MTEGSFNYAGVKSAAVDAMIEAMLKADDEESFISAVRALDRVLLSGDYVVPLFYLPRQWVAHWRELERPDDDAALRLSDRQLVARAGQVLRFRREPCPTLTPM